LDVEVQQQITSAFDLTRQSAARCAVVVAVHLGMFQQVALVDSLLKRFQGQKVVSTPSRSPGRGGRVVQVMTRERVACRASICSAAVVLPLPEGPETSSRIG